MFLSREASALCGAARLIRLKDPMEHSNLVNPNTFATTYNETIDATAKTVSRVQH